MVGPYRRIAHGIENMLTQGAKGILVDRGIDFAQEHYNYASCIACIFAHVPCALKTEDIEVLEQKRRSRSYKQHKVQKHVR